MILCCFLPARINDGQAMQSAEKISITMTPEMLENIV
jgi:hypothetical protein